MIVDAIETVPGFEALRTDWDAAYAADPEAQYFVSWPFISLALARSGTRWRVFAARPGPNAPYVAFLPVRINSYLSKRHQVFCHQIQPAGRAAWADYSSLVCAAGHEAEALPALGEALRRTAWAEFEVLYWLSSEERTRLLLGGFDEATFEHHLPTRRPNADGVDNDVCPIVDLPPTFEDYASQRMSANTRQKMRRFLRKLDAGEELRITVADDATLARDVGILVDLWHGTWRDQKKDIDQKAKKFRAILTGAHRRGFLRLPVLWRGEQPLGAMGYFLDEVKRCVLFKVAGRDETVTDWPVGLILHSHMIRWAIERGYQTYDFLRGNEPYKASYGPRERHLRSFTIRTHSRYNLHDRLDPLCLDEVAKMAADYRQKGQLARAEAGERQVRAQRP